MKRIKCWALAGFVLLSSPTAAFAVNCWNDCAIAATEWMHENEKTIAEAEAYHEGCVYGCQGRLADSSRLGLHQRFFVGKNG